MTTWHWFQPISFQVIWISAVLGGNQWLVVPLFLMCLHFVLSPCRREDIKVLPLALMGVALDATLTHLGFFRFPQFPIWLLVLWFGFVLNFGHSLKFLRKLRIFWLIVIGSVGGCYAYLASWKLDAVVLPFGVLVTACVLVVCWAIIFPILVKADLYIRREDIRREDVREKNHG